LRQAYAQIGRMSQAVPLSVLDLVPVLEGGTLTQAYAHAASLAAHAEAEGFARYWVAEHHGMAGIGGAATSVVLAHVGGHTSSIRLGSGGIMLPNHAPLQIAEQFGTLDALYPNRIDLALGRAPGSDGRVAMALRQGDPDAFPQQVVELQAYFAGDDRLCFPAVPGLGAKPEMWILGSSTYGAQLAAALGLPYGFASHFAPALLDEAVDIYRRLFRPSATLDRPHVMVACNVFAADTQDEARFLATTMQQGFVALRTGQGGGRVRPPLENYYENLPLSHRAMLDNVMACTAIGTQQDVSAMFSRLIERTGADEIIVAGQMFDQEARRRSFSIAAAAMQALG
jgi:luciferase family oxidoreductase group 1